MAQRTAVWQIAADFSRARRESDRTARSLKRLDKQREDLVENTLEGDEDLVKSNRTQEKSIASRIATLGRLHRAQRNQIDQTRAVQRAEEAAARTTERATGAVEKEAAAHRSAEGVVRRMLRTRRESLALRRQELAQTEEVVRAQERVNRATLANEKASLALEAAQRRLANTQRQHGTTSQQYADSLLSVERRKNDAASAAHRLTAATNSLASAQRRAASAGGGIGGTISRVSQAFFGGAAASKAFGIAISGIKWSALLWGIGAAVAGLSNLGAGLVALIKPLAQVGNAVAALPGLLGVAVGGIGTFVAALFGVGDALKAGLEAQKAMGEEATATAKAERDAARQIESAQRALIRARQNAADSARQNAESIRDAIEGVSDAERALVDAQEAVNEARRNARREVEDYRESLRDLELQERGASLSVEEARRRLNETLIDPGADDLAKAQAQLAYDEALDRLGDVRKEQKRAEEDAKRSRGRNDQQRAVLDALEAERDAAENLRDAHRSLADARKQAARDAEDAAFAIKEAEYALQDARETAATAASDAAKKQTEYNAALAALSPEAREFVRLLIGMRSEVLKLRDAAARGLLPGLGQALTNLVALVPLAEQGFFRFGRVIGDTAVRLSELLTSGPFTDMFQRILDSNIRLSRMFGRAIENVAAALVYVTDAAIPFTEWLGETVLGWTELWRASAKAGNETGGIAKSLERTREVLEILGGTLKNVWNWFKAIGEAGGDELGMGLLRGMESITEEWVKWAESPVGKGELAEWFEVSGEVLHEFSELLGAITRGLFDLGRENNIAPLLRQLREELGPALYNLLDAFADGEWASSMITAISKIVNLVAKLGDSGGGLGVFWDTLGKVADLFNMFPTGVLEAVVTGLATIAALRFASAVTGITALAKGVSKTGGFIGRRVDRRRARRATATTASDEAALLATGGGAGRSGRHRAGGSRMRDRFRNRMAQRNEGGFIAPGAVGSRGGSRGGSRRAARGGDPAKGMERVSKAAGKASRNVGKAAGVLGTLTLALGFLPGPIGEAAAEFSNFALIAAMVGPLLGTIGGWFLKLGGMVAKAVTMIGSWLAKIVPIVGRVLMFVGRLFMANPWMLLITALIIVVMLVVKYWDKIKAFIAKAIKGIINWIKKNWDIIKWFLGPLVWLIDAVVRNWDKITSVFMRAVRALLSSFTKVWNGLKGIFSAVWDWVTDKASDWWGGLKSIFSKGADALRGVFTRLKSGISKIWEGIKTAVSKPVEFMVNTVINDGIIKNYNRLAKILPGIDEIDEIRFGGLSGGGSSSSGGGGGTRPRAFAKGGIPSARDVGVYPGYTPGKDIGYIGISGGEAIMRPEWTRAIGADAVEEMNRVARTGGVSALRKRFRGNFASGGIPAVGGWQRHTKGYPWATWAGDINVPGIGDEGNPVRAYRDGVVSSVVYLGDRSYGRYVRINHGDANTLYAHLSDAVVAPGQEVKRGQVIGHVGAVGNASGPHLHFEISGGSAPVEASSSDFNLPGWAKKIVNKAGDWVKGKVFSGIDKLTSLFGGSDFVKMVAAVPKKLAGGLIDFISLQTGDARQAEVEVSKTPPEGFNRGGRVGGQGNRDTVPAMLTPGEFVIRKDAVERVGVANLERLNRGKRNRGRASGTQFFHRGGQVLGMRQGARGPWVKAFEKILDFKNVDGLWDPRLDRLLRTQGHTLYRRQGPEPRVNMPTRRDNKFLDWLRGPKDRSEARKQPVPTWKDARRQFDVGPLELYGWVGSLLGQIQRLPKFRTKEVLTHFNEAKKKWHNPEFGALNKRLGLRGDDFHADTQKALNHALAHTYKRKHDDFAFRPWKYWTPLEASIITTENQVERMGHWQNALDQIATWGFDSLLNDLLNKGVDDDSAYKTALEAVKNRALAKRLNDQLALLGSFSDEDFRRLIQMVGAFNSFAQPPGLRDMARHLGLSDYETVKLYEAGKKAGRFDRVSMGRRTRLENDIRSYRAGTFYFAEGGSVPGSGNRDSVPAMLTPGEFVLKKEAAKALGLRNLWALNNPQKFATGGLVMAPDVSRAPTRSTVGVSAHRMSASAAGSITNVTYDVDIHNPIAEKSTKSLTKALQRQSVLKAAGGTGWKNNG